MRSVSVRSKMTTFTLRKCPQDDQNIISSHYLTQYCGYKFLSKNTRKVGVKYIGVYDCMEHPLYEQNAKRILVWKIRWKSLDWLWCWELNPGLHTCQARTLSLRYMYSPKSIISLIKQNWLGHLAFQELWLHLYVEALARTKFKEFTQHNHVLFKFSWCAEKRKHRNVDIVVTQNSKLFANHNCLVHSRYDCYLLLLVWGPEEYSIFSLV